MKYPKDPYYLNAELVSKKKNNTVFDDNFSELVELVKDKNVFEVGFDFGQRLLEMKHLGINIVGGVEFDPNFGLYKKHSDLFNHGWNIRFIQIDFWAPVKQECVITNNFLSLFNKEDRDILLDKLKNMSEELYLNETCELDLPKEGNIYVFINVGRNDIESDSGADESKKYELPSFEPLKDRINKESRTIKDSKNSKADKSDSSGSV